MKIRWSVVMCLSLVATWAFAQKPTMPLPNKAPAPTPQTSKTIKAPIDLGVKKANTFNVALRRSGLPALNIPPPPAFVKLTPAAPVSGGAKIASVGASIYRGPGGDFPDGVFGLEGAPAPSPGPRIGILNPFGENNPFTALDDVKQGVIQLDFPAEGGALYFIDCRALALIPGNASTITFSRSGSTVTQAIAAEDGHYIHAFRTEGGARINQSVMLKFAASSYFFGCEITKAS